MGGIVGLLIGVIDRKPEWERFGAECDERFKLANFFVIKVPFGAYSADRICRSSFGEAYTAYIFGLPNSSVSMSVKAIESCLKAKFKHIEGKESQSKLIGLIEWAGDKLQLQKGNVAQALRMLRNEIIHEEKMVSHSAALETLKHASEVMCEVFPFTSVSYPTFCPQCKRITGYYPLAFGNANIGYSVNLQCNTCHIVFPVSVNP